MILTIHRGKHRPAAWWRQLALWYNKSSIRRKVTFFSNCVYYLEGEDQHDTNKLFGIGYFWNHQKNSARVGWRYDLKTHKIILSAYCYVNGNRIMKDICSCHINQEVAISLTVNPDAYHFTVEHYSLGKLRLRDTVSIPKLNRKKMSYQLGLYFGGNKPAPSKITIDVKKA